MRRLLQHGTNTRFLFERTKTKGKVFWYTFLSGVYREIVDAFKKKYPAVSMQPYRGGSVDLAPRLFNEAKAGRFVADALESHSREFNAVA